MKTKTILRVSQIALFFLLSFLCHHLSAQELPDFGVDLKKGDLYYLDYQVSNIHKLPIRSKLPGYHELDTHSVVKRVIRIEVLNELPEQHFILSVISERGTSQYKYGHRFNVLDDVYADPFKPVTSLGSRDKFSFGALTILTTNSKTGRVQSSRFTHIKVDKNLLIKKVYQSKEDALEDKGRIPQKPTHLWMDFDKIGIFLEKDQVDLYPYIRPGWKNETLIPHSSTKYLQKFSASYIDDFSVDIQSGWLHFAKFKETKTGKSEITLLKTIKGWKGEATKRTVVHGYLKNVKGTIRKANLSENIPYYFEQGKEDILTDKNGYFRWEGEIKQSTYFSLWDLAGDDSKKIHCYLQPGDSLYLNGDFSDLSERLVFSGRNKEANQFLNENGKLPLPGLTEWLGQLTIPFDRWEQSEINTAVVEARQKSIERLKIQKDVLDPRFFQDEYWRITYSTARFIRPSSKEKQIFDRDKYRPILNMQAEHLPSYWSYIDLYTKEQARHNQFNNLISRSFSFHESYNSAKLFLTGFPQHIVMYHALREALYHKKLPHDQLAFMINEFFKFCNDETLTSKISALSNQLRHTIPGQYFLNLQLLDTLGNKIEMKDFMGRKVILDPVFNTSTRFGPVFYQKWKETYPDLEFIQLALFEKPTDFTKYIREFPRKPVPGTTFYFPKDQKEKEKIYEFLALDPLHRYPYYPHVFMLDEKGKIIKQEYASFEDNLEAFAQLPTVIVPFWKNPIWKVAIPLSLLFGLLTWLSLRIIGRIREKNLERQRQMVEMELNSIRSQLNPHFVYNTMSSIQNLILSDRSEQASQYLAELAGLMRAVLNQTKKGIISLEEELATIRQYCKLEALRKSFAWNIKVDQSVDLHNTDIPALLLQPYVENAIIHGLRGNEVDGKIDLIISKKNGSLDIVIQDNGVGIVENQHRSLGGNHLGLHLNRKRLELLYGKLARVIIQDLNHQKKGKTGTHVAINIPI